MRKIDKGVSPVWFEQWKEDFRHREGREPIYKKDFYGAEKPRLREELLKEQGYICCYCMKRINNNTSHIEHFWPKGEFSSSDMDYANMLASCESESGGEYCGHKKNDWYIDDMVIPTSPGIEDLFRYLEDGSIKANRKDRRAGAANQMIENLGLDSFHLKRNRRQAIEASEVYDDVDYMEEDIRSFIDYYNHRIDGKFEPYCQCIIDCLNRQIA